MTSPARRDLRVGPTPTASTASPAPGAPLPGGPAPETAGALNDAPPVAVSPSGRARWTAPKPRRAEATPAKAPTPPPPALPRLAEQEILAILQNLTTHSPRARSLLREIRDEIDAADLIEQRRRL